MPAEVKICGLTRPEDAVVAADSGARWLGVVFAGGPREVDERLAERVFGQVDRRVGRVGVFGRERVETILDRVRALDLDVAQLHFDDSAMIARALKQSGITVWRVSRLASPADWSPPAADSADAVLVEPRVPGVIGGSGVSLDFGLAAYARDHQTPEVAFGLAGGLDPENVAAAIQAVRPDLVDVSSGVEIRPGIKDHDKIRGFVRSAGAATQ